MIIKRYAGPTTQSYLISESNFCWKKIVSQVRVAGTQYVKFTVNNSTYHWHQNDECLLCKANNKESLTHFCPVYNAFRNGYLEDQTNVSPGAIDGKVEGIFLTSYTTRWLVITLRGGTNQTSR